MTWWYSFCDLAMVFSVFLAAGTDPPRLLFIIVAQSSGLRSGQNTDDGEISGRGRESNASSATISRSGTGRTGT